jgi:hypothetical protein
MLDQLPAEAKTVDGIRRLTKQLCEALDALSEGVSLAAPDTVRALLAVRKEIVPVVDERLTKCAELIRRGLRDEAASYAADPPALVEAATLLDLSQLPRWKIWLAKLTELVIPSPPMPRMDLVAALTSAQDELVRLKPLLDAWRRMNLANAPLADRIALLGKLRKADPENELWFEALHEHQKQRLPGLEREVAAAINAQDDQRLGALVAEMQRDWIEPVPARIVAAAKAGLDRFRGGRIDRELDAVANSLAAAHEARDLAAARTLRDRWQELTDEKGSFAVDDPRLPAALPAVEWVDAHARMETVSEELWNSLDSRPGGLRTRQEWVRSLERLGNEMEDLAEKLEGDADSEAIERAHERIDRQRAQLDRDLRFRRMMMYVGVTSTAVVLGLTVWYFDDRSRYDRSVHAAVRDLRAAQEKIAAGTVNELPDFERSWPAKICGDPQVTSLLAIVRGEVEQQNGRRMRLAAALGKAKASLQAAEDSKRIDPFATWPPAFAEASRSLAEIDEGKLAVTDQEQADTVRVRSSLDRLARRLVGEADAACRTQIAAFDTELDKARELVAADAVAAVKVLDTVKAGISELRGRAAAPAVLDASRSHAPLRLASEPVVSQLAPTGPLLRKAESIDGMLVGRRKFREAVEELDRRLGDWPRYADQLQTIASDFADVPEARDFARAAESKAQWPAPDAWRAFQPWLKGLDVATPERARETITKFDALPAEAKNLPMARRIARDVMPAVKQFAERDLDKLRADLEGWLSGTWVAELRFIVQAGEDATYYCLEGPQEGAPTFTYVSGRKDANAGWPTKDERKRVQAVEQSPQSRLADVLRAAIRKAGQQGGIAIDRLFGTMIEAVLAADDMDPVPRLVTARKLLLLAAEYSRPWGEAGRPLITLLDDGQGGIPGVTIDQIWSFVPPTRERDTGYKITKQKSETLLDEIARGLADVGAAIAREGNVLATPPTELATLVGRLGRNDAGDLVAIWRGSAPSQGQVWWFPATADAAVAGNVDTEGWLRLGPNPGPAGTPLFTIASESNGSSKSGQQAAAGREK